MNNISAAEGWNSVWPLLQRVDLSADEENTRKTIGARTRSSGALLICSLKGCCLQLLQASAISALRQRSLWSLCSPCDRNFMGNRPACRLWCPKKNAVVKKAGMVGVCDIAQRSFPNLLTLVAVTATARPWQNLKARGCERFVLRRTEERPFCHQGMRVWETWPPAPWLWLRDGADPAHYGIPRKMPLPRKSCGKK